MSENEIGMLQACTSYSAQAWTLARGGPYCPDFDLAEGEAPPGVGGGGSGNIDDDIFTDEPSFPLSRQLPWGDRMKNKLLLREICVQADTIAYNNNNNQSPQTGELKPFDQNGEADADYFILDFAEDPDTEELWLVNPWNPVYPFDVLRSYKVFARNMNKQPTLVEDEKGLRTRFFFEPVIYYWYQTADPECDNFGWSTAIHNALPTRITVGYGLADSLPTVYDYFPDKSLKRITDANGIIKEYEYDNYGRLFRSLRNEQVLAQYHYSLFTELPDSQEDDYDTANEKAQFNFEENLLYQSIGSTQVLQSRSYIDPLGRANNSLTRITTDTGYPGTGGQYVHSGEMVYDNRNRVLKNYRPFEVDGTSLLPLPRYNTVENANTEFAETTYENDQRSRPLLAAKPGIAITNTHRMEYEYCLVNGRQFVCELGLGLVETVDLLGNDWEDYILSKTRVLDEDDKWTTEYSSSLGSKVATMQGINTAQEAVMLYHYDSQGNLDYTLNPEKQKVTYRYNLLGWLYEEQHPDKGRTRIMYNRSGQPVLLRDANGENGVPKLENEEEFNWQYEKVMEYDAFGRMTEQGLGNMSFWLDFVEIDDEPQNGIGSLHNYNFSYGSTCEWLANAEVWDETITPAFWLAEEHYEIIYPEKQWNYNVELFPGYEGGNYTGYYLNNRGPLKGRLSSTATYNVQYDLNTSDLPHQKCWYDYNSEGLLKWEIQQVAPGGITDGSSGHYLMIDYSAYDLRDQLLTQNLDWNCDRILDVQHHYVYDGYGRLADVYTNLTDVGAGGNRAATYAYDLATGLISNLKYRNPTCTNFDDDYEIEYDYDIRNRLKNIGGTLLDERILYDNETIDAIQQIQVQADECWNGNIRGTIFDYSLTGVPFNLNTAAGYRYDGLNRLLFADMIVADELETTDTYLSPDAQVGDMTCYYDRIGNHKYQKRYGPYNDSGQPNNHLLLYSYQYEPGKSRLDFMNGYYQAPDRLYDLDYNGNVIKDEAREIEYLRYNSNNLPTEMPGIRYLYSHQDQRIYKSTDHIQETYWRDNTGKELAIRTVTDGVTTWQYNIHGNTLISQYSVPSTQYPLFENTTIETTPPAYDYHGNTSIATLSYYVTDHLGNTKLTFKTNACNDPLSLESVIEYHPFGTILRQWNTDESERYLFNGQERDVETGYDYFKFRMYDSEIARFNGVDPLSAKYPANSPYAFAENKVIIGIELEGLEHVYYGIKQTGNGVELEQQRTVEGETNTFEGPWGIEFGSNYSQYSEKHILSLGVGSYYFQSRGDLTRAAMTVDWAAFNESNTLECEGCGAANDFSAHQDQMVAQKSGWESGGYLLGVLSGIAGSSPSLFRNKSFLPNTTMVVRGGINTPEMITGGTSTHPSGLTGISVNSARGQSISELSSGLRNNQIGVTTVGRVRLAGGDVTPTQGKNPSHATMTGLTPQKASELLNPPIPNPNAKTKN